jgi:hypothetical protein
LWVAVGQGTNSIAYSYDGIVWAGSTSGNNLFTVARNVAWNGTMWVAAGTGSYSIAYSYNGINDWTGTYSTNTFTLYSIAFNNKRPNTITFPTNLMVLGGQGSNSIAYSYDGTVWTGVTGSNSTSIFSTFMLGVAWNGTMWVGVGGQANTIAYSYDGIGWTGVTGSISIFNDRGTRVAWNGNLWVAVGGTNGSSENSPYTIAYSYYGATGWNPVLNSKSIFSYFYQR